MNEIRAKIDQLIKDVSGLEVLVQVEYNRIFNQEGQEDESLMVELNMLASLGALCRRVLSNQISQMNTCYSILKDMGRKEVHNAP